MFTGCSHRRTDDMIVSRPWESMSSCALKLLKAHGFLTQPKPDVVARVPLLYQRLSGNRGDLGCNHAQLLLLGYYREEAPGECRQPRGKPVNHKGACSITRNGCEGT
jgi:hypothetical protein